MPQPTVDWGLVNPELLQGMILQEAKQDARGEVVQPDQAVLFEEYTSLIESTFSSPHTLKCVLTHIVLLFICQVCLYEGN